MTGLPPGSGQPDGPHLVVQFPEGEFRTVRIVSDVTTVGSSDESDVRLPDRRIEKQHAEILRGAGGFAVRAARRRARVLLNGTRVREHALADGDMITLGTFHPPTIAFCSPAPRQRETVSASEREARPAPAGQRDLANLGRFLEFSRLHGGAMDLAAVLDQVVDVAMGITGAERGSLILVRADGGLDFEVVREHGAGAVPREGHVVSETIVRRILATGEPRIVSDIAHDSALSNVASIVSLQLGSAAAIPIWRFKLGEADERAESTDEVFGVLYLDSRKKRDAFSRFDVGMLESLAREASSTIENARLLRESEEKRRMEREMRTAREVQAALLPESYWNDPHFEVAGSCVPCLELGGDYLDQFRMDDGKAGFVVADVCGKGLPAALMAAALQGALAAGADGDHGLAAVVERTNRVVCRIAPLGDFITLLCCALSPDGGLTYVNAGHCPLLTLRGGEVRSLEGRGPALGVHEATRYEDHSAQLRDGEIALLFTDGVLEAENAEGEMFGPDRLRTAVGDSSTAAEAVNRIVGAVEAFRGSHPVVDDITLLAVRYLARAHEK